MTTNYWKKEDFAVFSIDGLAPRMEALITNVRPKLQQLGDKYASFFSVNLGEEFYAHVAKHARRTVNPPNDTWVAFAPYKRGYKALPHFQIGLWGSHLFIVVAIIYEVPNKQQMATQLLQHQARLRALPQDFIISGDHMSPQAFNLHADPDKLPALLTRLQTVKKAEFLVGKHISAEDAVQLSDEQFYKVVEDCFNELLPIYKLMLN